MCPDLDLRECLVLGMQAPLELGFLVSARPQLERHLLPRLPIRGQGLLEPLSLMVNGLADLCQ